MTPDEQAEWIYIARLRGNRHYKTGRYEQAVEVYLEAATAAKIREDEGQVHMLLCNLSSCLLAQGKPSQALKMASQVLVEDPVNLRALERRARAYIALQQYSNAKADLGKALNLPQGEGSRQRLDGLLREMRMTEKKDKQTYERMFPDKESEDEEWAPVVSSVVSLFTLPVKLYRAIESLCRRQGDD
jgi:tetratricopeptide (TPR) repeat protein